MATKFTVKQQEVIRHREGGLLVSAAAGSGKTTVMVEQIVSMLMEEDLDLSIDQILVVTFTKAAAASMKEKLEERLSRELEIDESNERIAEQIRLIPLSSIMTNHAFSLQLVKDYITRLEEIDPGFRVAGETEIALLKQDVLRESMEEMYSKALEKNISEDSENFLAFVNTFSGGRQDKKIEEIILNVYEYMLSDPEPETWLLRAVETLDPAYQGEGSLYEMGELEEEDENRRHLIETLVVPAMKGLQYAILTFDKAFRKAKAEKNMLDFDDFEHDALRLLKDEAICDVLREKYRYIFVDEYQDCNRLQETILRKIARLNENGDATNIFMVGDVKQSIYRFRLADPSLFTDKYQRYPKAKDMHLISLNQNFRSGNEVIDAVNTVFRALMRKEVGGIDYGEDEQLNPSEARLGEKREEFKTRLIVEQVEGSSNQLAAEAGRIGKEIQTLIREGWKYSDIVILMRAVKNAQAFYEILTDMGIPVSCETTNSFYDTLEIRTIMNLLKVIDNPRQDIPLMGVLHSPIVGMSDEDLGRIRLAEREGDYYDALVRYETAGNHEDTREKVSRFLKKLNLWREMSLRRSIHDLLFELYMDTGYYIFVSAMVGGESRRENLDYLLDQSIEFEKGSYSGLYQFLRFVEKLDQDKTIEKEPAGSNGGKQAVRIMTIHKSKGLEFPVVFVAGMGKGWNGSDEKGDVVLHDRLGIGVVIKDAKKKLKLGDVKKQQIIHALRHEMLSEEIRLLYVAMTRAKERLFLIGGRDEKFKKLEISEGILTEEAIMEGTSYLSWVENIVLALHPGCIDYEIEEALPEEKEFLSITPEREDLAEEEIRIEEQQLREEKAKLLWEYKDLWKSKVPRVLSVSEVKHSRMEEVARELQEDEGAETWNPGMSVGVKDPLTGSDAAEKETTEITQETEVSEEEKKRLSLIGAVRGTAFHEIMARCNVKDLFEKKDREREKERLVREGFLTREDVDLVPDIWISRFARSDLAKRIVSSEQVVKEQAFVLDLPLQELKELSERFDYGGDGSGSVILQGIIDLYFYEGKGENKEIVLVDYKTDKVLDEATVAGYAAQLQIYAKALEDATGCTVKERFLYAVRDGREIHC